LQAQCIIIILPPGKAIPSLQKVIFEEVKKKKPLRRRVRDDDEDEDEDEDGDSVGRDDEDDASTTLDSIGGSMESDDRQSGDAARDDGDPDVPIRSLKMPSKVDGDNDEGDDEEEALIAEESVEDGGDADAIWSIFSACFPKEIVAPEEKVYP